MSVDPTPETYPLLFAVVGQHIAYYKEAAEYVSKRHVLADLKKDSQYMAMIEEAGLDPAHPNHEATFRRLFWDVVRKYMNPAAGWWAKTGGRSAIFFHDEWGTPEDCRDAVNFRIRQREQDAGRLNQIYAITQTKCGQLGFVFDPQFADDGALVGVEVWKAAA